MRTAKRGPYCTSWGFAVYAYNEGYNETGRKARKHSGGGKVTSAGGSSARHLGKGAGGGGSGGGGSGGGSSSHAGSAHAGGGGHAGGRNPSSSKRVGALRSDEIMKETIDTSPSR